MPQLPEKVKTYEIRNAYYLFFIIHLTKPQI